MNLMERGKKTCTHNLKGNLSYNYSSKVIGPIFSRSFDYAGKAHAKIYPPQENIGPYISGGCTMLL